MEMVVKSMETAVEAIEMALGHFPVPAGCRNREFCSPKLVFDGGAAAELYWEKTPNDLGFSRRRTFIGGRAMLEVDQGAHTI
jgi:hypothetical protein